MLGEVLDGDIPVAIPAARAFERLEWTGPGIVPLHGLPGPLKTAAALSSGAHLKELPPDYLLRWGGPS